MWSRGGGEGVESWAPPQCRDPLSSLPVDPCPHNSRLSPAWSLVPVPSGPQLCVGSPPMGHAVGCRWSYLGHRDKGTDKGDSGLLGPIGTSLRNPWPGAHACTLSQAELATQGLCPGRPQDQGPSTQQGGFCAPTGTFRAPPHPLRPPGPETRWGRLSGGPASCLSCRVDLGRSLSPRAPVPRTDVQTCSL